jgi:hypothetical protein
MSHYVLMLLHNKCHWSHYKMVVRRSNVTLPKVLVANRYRKLFNDVGVNERQCGSIWM